MYIRKESHETTISHYQYLNVQNRLIHVSNATIRNVRFERQVIFLNFENNSMLTLHQTLNVKTRKIGPYRR